MIRKTSLTEQAYRQLRDDLVSCRIAPGDKINIKDIASSLGFSLGAVREALSRLTAEGFVTLADGRGFRAGTISIAEMVDLIQVRAEIEGQCLRRAIARGGLDWESEIVSTAHRLARTAHDGAAGDTPDEDHAAADAAFQRALVAACDSPWLLRMRDWLHAQSERYRHGIAPPDRTQRDIADDHGPIVAAVLARDADRAVALHSAHILDAARPMIEHGDMEGGDGPGRSRPAGSA